MQLLLQLAINGVAIGCLYALVAVGFAIIFGVTRIFHFAHGATYLLAAYAYYAALSIYRLPALLGLAIAALVAVVFGSCCERFVYRPMLRSESSFLTVFVASFGLFIVVENLVVLVFGSGFSTLESSLSKGLPFGPFELSPVGIIAILGSAGLLIGLELFLARTDAGTALRAMADSAELVQTIGLDRNRCAQIAFAAGSLLAVPAAVLNVNLSGLSPQSGTSMILIAMAATIVGGIGSLYGAALGGVLLGVAENVGIWRLPASWGDGIAFGVLLVFLLLRPSGIVSALRQ